ncbi:GNAT family N-acetyltransferase [Paracoccus sp. R86501]|uniref:GNAT family N-acetyltransferase n=1 Tax=Paracoccus sp. R86501 TaxID=3101711 RepID=UPI0036704EB3
MRNPRQADRTSVSPARILGPIPADVLPDAAALWRDSFGGRGDCDPTRGLVALDGQGRVTGVMGLRDGQGGFLRQGAGWRGWLYRPAPPTRDLVIDGIAVIDRRAGLGRALVHHALLLAGQRGFPGLRAEVRQSNPGALAFYRALGFHAECRGRYGMPWWGQVQVLRRDVDA